MDSTATIFDLQVDEDIKQHLTDTARWAKFLSIVGFIFFGLLLIFSLFAIGSVSSSNSAYSGATQMILLLVFVALYICPLIFLFNFSRKMQTALRQNDQQSLSVSFRSLKYCYKYLGILTIVILGLYLLVFVFGLLAASSGRL